MADGKVVIDTSLNNKGFTRGVNNLKGELGGLSSVVKKLGGVIVAAFSVKDDHIVLDPSLLLTERPNQRGDMNIIAIFPEQRVFPTIFPINDPLSSHPFDLVDSRIEHTGIQFESHAVDHDYMFMSVYGDNVHADVLSFHIRPHPNLRRASFLVAVQPPIAKSCGIKNLDPPLKSRFSTACRPGSVSSG